MRYWDSVRSEVISYASTAVLSNSDVKLHLRLDHSDDDSYISNLVLAAQEYVSNYLNFPLINATCKSYFNIGGNHIVPWWDGVRQGSLRAITGGALKLDYPHVHSITSVKSYNENSVETTVDSSGYRLDVSMQRGAVVPNVGVTWGENLRLESSVVVEYISGFGPLTTDVPFIIKQAILILVAHWYENRQYYNGGMPFSGQIGMVNATIAHSVNSMLAQYRGLRL